MITYLIHELNLTPVKASNILTNFGGTVNFTPLIGALLADSFAGRFWTIVFGTLIYEMGMVGVTISAILPNLRPPHCPTQLDCKEASSEQLSFFYISLLLMCIGTGGIRSCVVTFAADQLDMSKSKTESRGCNFFNMYYFCMMFATLTALTVVVYVQDHYGWGWGFGIPAFGMGLSILAFVVGSPLYNKVKLGGSPLIRLAQVVVAALKKRKAVVPADSGLLYHNRELDAALFTNGRLLHSNQFKWLDRAAVITTEELKDSNRPNLWRLATVHRVEELKSIIRMLPIWSAGILLVTSNAHVDNFTITQAQTMNRHMSPSFKIPAASVQVSGVITILVGLTLYDRFFVPLTRRFTKKPTGITCLQRMGIGFIINISATCVSALVEIKRKSAAEKYWLLDKPTAVIPISVFWLVPQYCLRGLADVFISVGHLEFLYDQSPESLRSTAMALNDLTCSVGNYIAILIMTLVKKNWLPDRNLNRGRLEYYYWLVSGIQVVNLVYYVICGWFYTYKPIEEFVEESNNGDLELSTDK